MPYLALDAKGTVFMRCDPHETCTEGNFYALDGRTGALKWQSACSQIIDSVPVLISDGTVYVGNWNHTYALNTADGSVKWIFKTGSPSSLAPDGTFVVVGFEEPGIYDTIYALKGEGRPVLPWDQRSTNFAIESSAVQFDTSII